MSERKVPALSSILNSAAFGAINSLEQVPQAQYSLDDQLTLLRIAAVKLGLYDAADHLTRVLNDSR